jgi:hypothetical protein
LAESNLKGILPGSIGAFIDITHFNVEGNAIEGAFPATARMWTKLAFFFVYGNRFSGGPLPVLQWEQMVAQNCLLFTAPKTNSFNCPFSAGVLANCRVTSADCSQACTGSSTQLPQDQCDAWKDFYDALNGDGWTTCKGTRTDPCSCLGKGGSQPVCSGGKTVNKMCVAHRGCRAGAP